jgi:hypothetical protein
MDGSSCRGGACGGTLGGASLARGQAGVPRVKSGRPPSDTGGKAAERLAAAARDRLKVFASFYKKKRCSFLIKKNQKLLVIWEIWLRGQDLNL